MISTEPKSGKDFLLTDARVKKGIFIICHEEEDKS
jgi:hypothetical protein